MTKTGRKKSYAQKKILDYLFFFLLEIVGTDWVKLLIFSACHHSILFFFPDALVQQGGQGQTAVKI